MDKWIKNFLNYNKDLVGLADWNILTIKEELKDGSFAEIAPDIFEKEVYVSLPPIFFSFPKKRQKNILIHELIHCRVLIHKIEIKEFVDRSEEQMVNDLTRGMEKLL